MIGEEIYDEFDAEGAQQLQAYAPTPSAARPKKAGDLKSILKRNGSAPDLTSASAPTATERVVPVALPPVSKSGSSTPSYRPLPLPALKNLSFFTTRSRSAPPIQRPKADKKASETSAGGHTPDGADAPPALPPSDTLPKLTSPLAAGARISEEEIDPATGLSRRSATWTPAVRVESDTMEAVPSSSTDPASFVTAQTPMDAVSPMSLPISVVPASVAQSRTTSPAPGLEAFIKGSKRRQSFVAGAGAGGMMKERSSSIGQKGTRFKSSPLTGGERGGVVVAEQVMRNLRSDHLPSSSERTPEDGVVMPDE
jgi:metal transporter CNNM